jgi:hypothetical protein
MRTRPTYGTDYRRRRAVVKDQHKLSKAQDSGDHDSGPHKPVS